MNKIKFSHEYEKMVPGCLRTGLTVLLEVFISTKEELSDIFLKYDTEIKTFQGPRKYYELPKGKILILLLSTDNSLGDFNLWTTIRRWTPEKEEYYRSIRGQQVEIIVDTDKS